MDGQLVFTLIFIGLAGGYLLHRGRRTWISLKGGCSGGCGCARGTTPEQKQPALIPVEQLVLRHRSKRLEE